MDLSAIIPTTSSPREGHNETPEISVDSLMASEKDQQNNQHSSKASSDSGSLTQRAAMIRDELLGNDSLEQDSEHESVSSSNDSGVELDPSSQEEVNGHDDEELEARLNSSSIAHSLRHIAVAFDEKVSLIS